MIRFIVKNLLKHKETIKQFIKFSFIGISGVALHLLVTYVFTEFLGLFYILSYYIGQFIGMSNNFIWNKYLTFGKKDGRYVKQYLLSILFYGTTALISGGIVYILTDYLGLRYIISTIIVIPIIAFFNFISHKYIVFKY